MAQRLQFGDKATADVKLQLLHTDGTAVDEALAILPVASEWLFHDSVDRCLRYLDAVRWSGEQEAKLRALLSTLHITPLPDLAARLGTGECEINCVHLEMLEETLQRRFSVISQTSNWYHRFWNKEHIRNGIEQYVVESYKANPSSEIADVCRSVIVKEFSDNVELIKSEDEDLHSICRSILWLLDLIQRCDDEGLYETVLKLFCEDVDLLQAVCSLRHRTNMRRDSLKCLLDIIINRFLKRLASGEIITPSSFRNLFLTNWVPALVINIFFLRSITKDDTFVIDAFEEDLEKGMICIAETLPLPEQKCFYHIWEDAYRNNNMNSNRAFEWWTKILTEGHHMSSHPVDCAISKRILVTSDHTTL